MKNLKVKKKITYIYFIDELAIKSPVEKKNIILSLNTLLSQTVPAYELFIIFNNKISKDVYALLNKKLSISDAADFNKADRFNLSYSKSDYLFLFETYRNDIANAFYDVFNSIRTEWIVFVDNEIVIAPYTTYHFIEVAHNYPNASMIYGDSDLINKENVRCEPTFKPIFSLDLLYSQNYIGSFYAIKKDEIFKKIEYVKKKYTLDLFSFKIILDLIEELVGVPAVYKKICNLTKKIIHTPVVLHSKKISTKSKSDNYLGLLADHTERVYPKKVQFQRYRTGIYRHKWSLPNIKPFVSIIIPTRDGFDILSSCLKSIFEKKSYYNYEIIIIDNQSQDLETLHYLNQLNKIDNIRVIKYSKPFNYSEINNFAVQFAKGEILGFINNDIQVITDDWLTELIGHAIRPDIGCVGAMHFYPDKYIQHAGVIVGLHGVADHAFKGLKKNIKNDRYGYLYSIRNPDAVTAATLFVKRSLFDMVGGFDSKHLKIAFNDVDLCLKISELGYRCLWTPFAELFHFESKTRNNRKLKGEVENEAYEHFIMKERWKTDRYIERDLLRYYRINFRGLY